MLEKLMHKFHDLMVKYVGINWRTTLAGMIAVASGFVLTTPEAFNWLPETVVSWMEFLAKISVLLAGGSFAVFAKDKNVTGGREAATEEARKRIGM